MNNRICPECKKRKVVVEYSMEPMATIRSGYGMLYRCRECYIEDIKAYIKSCQKNLREQKKLLEEESNGNKK